MKMPEIVSVEEAETLDAVCCMRVEDMPIPPVLGQIERCSECGERVWVSHSSPREPRRICVQCLADGIEKDTIR
jgi:formylmethanofuran dehydrogenase subunit E